MRGARGVRGVTRSLFQERACGAGRVLPILSSDYASTVRRLGVARLPGVLSQRTARALRSFVFSELKRRQETVAADPRLRSRFFTPGIYQKFARAGAVQTRWDLNLPLDAVVRTALREALFGGAGCLGTTLCALLGGSHKEAKLWELAAIISEPGAAPQLLHSDTLYTPLPCLFSAFIALQDVSPTMGPTRFLLGTHAEVAHRKVSEACDQDFAPALRRADSSVAVLRTGEAALYDSRLIHCGGANRSSERRVLLTITFRHPAAQRGFDNDDSRSIRAEYKQPGISFGDVASENMPCLQT